VPYGERQRAIRGHVTSVLQPGPDQWAGFLPLPEEAIPEFLSVLLLNAAASDEDVVAMASRARAAQVRAARRQSRVP
jgi:hypothetical protein